MIHESLLEAIGETPVVRRWISGLAGLRCWLSIT